MNRNSKSIANVLLAFVYLISFYCFFNTSVFSGILNSLDSLPMAIVLVNIPILVVLLYSVTTDGTSNKAIYVLCALFILPAVLSQSKLNFIESILSVKFKCDLPTAVIALSAVTVIIGCIAAHTLKRNFSQYELWLEKGAYKEDVDEIYIQSNKISVLVISVISVIALLVTFIGYQLLAFSGAKVEPALIALLGIIVAGVCIGLYVKFNAF